MLFNIILGCLALLSLLLLLWQWAAAARFPLHTAQSGSGRDRPVTVLKPLKGCDPFTENCLRSWFEQDYRGPIQILFGVASADDPVCPVVRRLIAEFPGIDAELVICEALDGANAKVSKLARLETRIRHEAVVVSDADVRVPRHLLTDLVGRMEEPGIGLAHCFYRNANPHTFAMRWEALTVNADFWSQVLQSRMLKPVDFALGAVMATRRTELSSIGGFASLKDCLADDYQLGHRLADRGRRIEFSPVVVECWSDTLNWREVWRHQVRWARTIRVCQPIPYFFSVLSNPTFWPWLWVALAPGKLPAGFALGCAVIRMAAAFDLQRRLTRSVPALRDLALPLLKDLLQTFVWASAFAGNRIEWRGARMKLRPDGTLEKVA